MSEQREKATIFFLSKADHAQLRIAAAYEGISMAEFARRAILQRISEGEHDAKAISHNSGEQAQRQESEVDERTN